jgi:hypothetical protein
LRIAQRLGPVPALRVDWDQMERGQRLTLGLIHHTRGHQSALWAKVDP